MIIHELPFLYLKIDGCNIEVHYTLDEMLVEAILRKGCTTNSIQTRYDLLPTPSNGSSDDLVKQFKQNYDNLDEERRDELEKFCRPIDHQYFIMYLTCHRAKIALIQEIENYKVHNKNEDNSADVLAAVTAYSKHWTFFMQYVVWMVKFHMQ